MAGYPAEYEWNEAAKACRLGYLDQAGTFHAATVRRTVPKTYGSGLQGHLITFVSSVFVSLLAAYILRRY